MTERFGKLRRWAGPVVSLLLLVAGAWVISRLLAEHPLAELASSVASRPAGALLRAVAFSAAAWLTLTLFDTLAFREVHVPTHWRHVARDAFTSYALSLNIGASALSGGALRLRLYERHGFGAKEVSRIMAFNITTMWLGYCALAGVVLLAVDIPTPPQVHLPRAGLQALGAGGLALAVLYVVLAWRRRGRPLRIRSWAYPLPDPRWAVVQACVSAVHWACSAAAIHALLPEDSATYLQVLGVYVLEAIIGLLLQVPGGLGVLEAVFVLSLRGLAPEAEVLASILAFRVVYFWGAFALALVLLADHELLRKRRRKWREGDMAGRGA